MGSSDAGASGVVVIDGLGVKDVRERLQAAPAVVMVDVREWTGQNVVAPLALRALAETSNKVDVRKVDPTHSKLRSGGRSKAATVARAAKGDTLCRNLAEGIERPLAPLRHNSQRCAQG